MFNYLYRSSNSALQKDTEFQNAESAINLCEISPSISTLPNEEETLSVNVAEPYDALDDSDSNHSSIECGRDAEVDDSQHASIDQSIVSPYDISRAVQLKKTRCLTDIEKFNFFNNHFIPAFNHKFPTKQYGSRQHSFQYAWLKKFNGLVYSADDEGAYCKFCVLFGKFSDKCINTLGVLIEQSLTNWKKANEKLTAHLSTPKYHKEAMELANNFLSVVNNKTPSVRHQIDSIASQHIQQNCVILKSIIDTVIVCGQQGIPLRGHRDDYASVSSHPDQNHGNFLELLNFHVRAGDLALKQHLATAARNATYTSKTIQNEIINLCGRKLRQSIISAVQSSPFYSVIADEDSDAANDEQLSISLRYLNTNGEPEENFFIIKFCRVSIWSIWRGFS